MRDDVSYIDAYSNVLTQATSASELCRKLVHSDLTTPAAIGASIYAIDQQAHINLVGSYGTGLPASGVTVWDEHPFGRAARNGKLHTEEVETIDGSPATAYCLPLLKGDEPIGLLTLTLKPGQAMHTISGDALSAISRITAIWLDGLNLGSTGTVSAGKGQSASSPESLTERQLAVLRLMAEGKTNAEIAQEMILSESTIRQETVRIYRALGVSARADASKRAKHLGIIDRLAI